MLAPPLRLVGLSSFSPLFIGARNVTSSALVGLAGLQTFSPLFIGARNVTPASNDALFPHLELSVPFSSGQGMLLSII